MFLMGLSIFVGLMIVWKICIKLTTGIYRGNERLDGKTVIVTGANTGIGYVSAKDFAKRGARVLLVCRNMKKAENAKLDIIKEIGNKNIEMYQVDFSSLDSIRKGANEILKKEKRIDILLNNAGANLSDKGKVSRDGLNCLMQTNYYGPFLFTNLLLDKIKKSTPSRIVNVASRAHTWSTLNMDIAQNIKTKKGYKNVYADSKLGNILFTKELAKKLKGTGVTTNSLHPGAFASEIMREKNIFYRILWDKILPFVFKSVEEAAHTSIYLCVSPEVANISGEYFSDCKLIKSSNKSYDSDFAKRLWDYSEKAVNMDASEIHY